jgi:tetratricopeptide (TPR) repeat protein
MGKTIALLAGMLLLVAPAAYADDSRLARTEIYGHALKYVEKTLAANPGDPQALMLKGRFLIELGRHEEAVALLQKLSVEHPELGEPDQMLALLYAADDLYGKPRALLQRRLVAILGAARQPLDGATRPQSPQ